MSRVILGFVASLLLVPGIALAEFVYTGLEVGYVDVEFDSGAGTLDGNGYRFAGALELNEQWFMHGEYEDRDFDSILGVGIGGSHMELGAGYAHSVNGSLDFVGTAAWVNEEVNVSVPGFGAVGVDSDGIALGGGLRARVADSFEFGAMLQWVDLDGGSDTGIELMGRYFFTPRYAFTVETDINDNFDTLTFGFRAQF